MPAKTKYRNRKNKTRRHNNKTKRCRRRQSKCSLAKLMRGGEGDIELQTQNKETEGDDLEKQLEGQGEAEPENKPEGEETQPSTTESSASNNTIKLKRYNDQTVVDLQIKQDDTYKTILGETTDPFVLIINNQIMNENKIPDDSKVDVSGNEVVYIFTYKYKNLVDNQIDYNIPKIGITTEDLKKVEISPNEEPQPSVIGNKVLDTECYIDGQGILRKYNKSNNILQKVLIIDVPEKSNVDNSSNDLLTEANKVLDDLGSLLEKIKDSMPNYMEIDITVREENKRYIISKETPYIVGNVENM